MSDDFIDGALIVVWVVFCFAALIVGSVLAGHLIVWLWGAL